MFSRPYYSLLYACLRERKVQEKKRSSTYKKKHYCETPHVSPIEQISLLLSKRNLSPVWTITFRIEILRFVYDDSMGEKIFKRNLAKFYRESNKGRSWKKVTTNFFDGSMQQKVEAKAKALMRMRSVKCFQDAFLATFRSKNSEKGLKEQDHPGTLSLVFVDVIHFMIKWLLHNNQSKETRKVFQFLYWIAFRMYVFSYKDFFSTDVTIHLNQKRKENNQKKQQYFFSKVLNFPFENDARNQRNAHYFFNSVLWMNWHLYLLST